MWDTNTVGKKPSAARPWGVAPQLWLAKVFMRIKCNNAGVVPRIAFGTGWAPIEAVSCLLFSLVVHSAHMTMGLYPLSPQVSLSSDLCHSLSVSNRCVPLGQSVGSGWSGQTQVPTTMSGGSSVWSPHTCCSFCVEFKTTHSFDSISPCKHPELFYVMWTRHNHPQDGFPAIQLGMGAFSSRVFIAHVLGNSWAWPWPQRLVVGFWGRCCHTCP